MMWHYSKERVARQEGPPPSNDVRSKLLLVVVDNVCFSGDVVGVERICLAFPPHPAAHGLLSLIRFTAPHTQHASTTTTAGSRLAACRGTRARWEPPPRGRSTTGPRSHGSGRSPGFVAGVRSHYTAPAGSTVGRLAWRRRHTPNTRLPPRQQALG